MQLAGHMGHNWKTLKLRNSAKRGGKISKMEGWVKISRNSLGEKKHWPKRRRSVKGGRSAALKLLKEKPLGSNGKLYERTEIGD